MTSVDLERLAILELESNKKMQIDQFRIFCPKMGKLVFVFWVSATGRFINVMMSQSQSHFV